MSMDITFYKLTCPEWLQRRFCKEDIDDIVIKSKNSRFLKLLKIIKIEQIKYFQIGYCDNHFVEGKHPMGREFPNLKYYNFFHQDVDFLILVVQTKELKQELRQIKRIMKKNEITLSTNGFYYFTINY